MLSCPAPCLELLELGDYDVTGQHLREDMRLIVPPAAVENVQWNPVATELLQRPRDVWIRACPVGAHGDHTDVAHLVNYGRGVERQALVHLTRDAPRRRKVDEHRAALIEQLSQPRGGIWLPEQCAVGTARRYEPTADNQRTGNSGGGNTVRPTGRRAAARPGYEGKQQQYGEDRHDCRRPTL